MAIVQTEGDPPKDDVILGCGMALRVVGMTRPISRGAEHRTRRKLPIFFWACLKLDEGMGVYP